MIRKKVKGLLKFPMYLFLLFSIGLHAQEKSNQLLPSEALTLMINQVDLHPEKKRIDATMPYLSRVTVDNLSREEQFYLGDIYFWNFMPQEAHAAFAKVREGNDEISRAAWQRMMQIEFRAFEKHEKVETQIAEFRKNFKPTPKDRYYMFEQVNNVSNKYADEKNHEKVVELVEEELGSLDYNGPYQSFLLPAYQFRSFKALGKEAIAFALLEKAIEELQSALDQRRKKIPTEDPDYMMHSSRVKGMMTIVTNKLGYEQMNDELEKLIGSLEKANQFLKGET